MKRIHSLMLVVALVMFGTVFTSCEDNKDEKDTKTTAINFTTPSSVGFKIGDAKTFTISVDVKNPSGATAMTLAGELPAGLTFTDNADGTAKIEGTATEAKDATVTVTATNNSVKATQEIVVSASAEGTAGVDNIAAFIANADEANVVKINGEVVVAYANEYSFTKDGKEMTSSNVYIQDASGYIVIYGYELTGLVAGDKLTGLAGKFKKHYDTNEVVEAVIPAKVAGTAPAATVKLPGDLSKANLNQFVAVENVTITKVQATDNKGKEVTNVYGNKDGGKIFIFNKFHIDGFWADDFVEGGEYTVEGIIVAFPAVEGGIELAPTKVTKIGGGTEPTGDSTEADPFTIEEAIANQGAKGWVKGFIVGQINGMKITDAQFDNFTAAEGKTQGTNLLIAASADETNPANCFPVQLTPGTIRGGLNVVEHPENKGKEVIIYGSLQAYFGAPAVKAVEFAKMGDAEFGLRPGATVESTPITIAELLAKPVGDEFFEITGAVSNIKSTEYGNFDITDATGSVFVYGLTATLQARNDKSFASLGIVDGDNITIIGKRGEYQGTIQVVGAYFKSKN